MGVLMNYASLLTLAGFVGFGAALALWWVGIPQLLLYQRRLKRYNALIASHLKKRAQHEKKLADAFRAFELKCNEAGSMLRATMPDWDAIADAMREAREAWRRFDTLMRAYERQRRELASASSTITKAPS